MIVEVITDEGISGWGESLCHGLQPPEIAEVIDDREGEEEDLQGEWRPPAEEGQDTHGKRDIRRHRDSPTFRPIPAKVEGGIEEGRHEHSAEGRGRRERGLADRGEFAVHEFALDLEPDHEEENGHQAVVHRMAKALIEPNQV